MVVPLMVDNWSQLSSLELRRTHMIDQLLGPILDLVVGMKQVDMLLDDHLWILTSGTGKLLCLFSDKGELPKL